MNTENALMFITYLIVLPAILITLLITFTSCIPLSDSGCENYQNIRSIFTSEGVAIGCEYNGTAWHFNETLVNLTFHEVKEYVI